MPQSVITTAQPVAAPRPGRPTARVGARRAFSILEVMSATAVMAMGLAAAIYGIQIGLRNLDVARTSTAIGQVMQSEAERIRLLNWDALSALPNNATTLSLADALNNRALKNGNIVVTRTISNVSGYTNMKEVRLVATWRSIDGLQRTRIIQFRYTKGGVYDYYST